MAEAARYKFRIDAYTPESMPFGRLLEYYKQINALLGDPDGFHLVGINRGSLESVFAVDSGQECHVAEAMRALEEERAPKKCQAAMAAISRMLDEDGASGGFGSIDSGEYLELADSKPRKGTAFSIRGTANFTGMLYHISGRDESASLRILDIDSGRTVYCTAPLDTARKASRHLFEKVKIEGIGIWTRDEDENWSVGELELESFIPVSKEDPLHMLERLRQLDIEWPDDMLEKIQQLRSDE